MTYLVRIELHYGTQANYTQLHSAMAIRGFSREIRADDGTLYQLPTAEYVIVSTATGDQVRQAASAAANSTGCKYAVLVVAYTQAWWHGLNKTRAA